MDGDSSPTSQTAFLALVAAAVTGGAITAALLIREAPPSSVLIVASACLAGIIPAFVIYSHIMIRSRKAGRRIAESSPAYIVPIEPPAPPKNFEGREDSLRRLRKNFDAPQSQAPAVAVISGVAGIGKTALAVKYASTSRRRFPDGQIYAYMEHGGDGSGSTFAILGQFLTALQKSGEAIPDTLEGRKNEYRKRTSNSKILVILDHSCHPDCVKDLLPEGSRCATVVLSRTAQVIRPGQLSIELTTLTEDEGLRLLTATVGSSRVVSNSTVAKQLAATGHPLAIKLAATALTRGAIWPLNQARAESSTPFDARAAVKSNLDLISSLLTHEERRALRCVARTNQPVFEVWELASLLGVSDEAARSLADGLTRVDVAHRTSGGRAGIVEYAVNEHIWADLTNQVRMTDGPDEQSERPGPTAQQPADRRQQEDDIIHQLNQGIWELRNAGDISAAFESARHAAAIARKNENSRLEALALATIADLRLEIGNITGAHELARAAETLDPGSAPARALRCLGSILRMQEEAEYARSYLDRALLAARRDGDIAEEACTLVAQALLPAPLQDRESSSIVADRAIALIARHPDLTALQPTAHLARAEALLEHGQIREARAGLSRVAKMLSSSQPLVRAWLDLLYARTAIAGGSIDEAVQRSAAAIEEFGVISHRYGVARARLTLGLAHAARPGINLAKAVRDTSEALETLQNCDDPFIATTAKQQLAGLLIKQGTADNSAADLEAAEKILESLGDEENLSELRAILAPIRPSSRRRLSRTDRVS
jgi:tetratricopeptide (TPR) repeat protein